MGCYSFLTSDTGEQIKSVFTSYPNTPSEFYLLQPSGKHIYCANYTGNGVISGIDVWEWLAKKNARSFGIKLKDLSDNDLRQLGIDLFCGDVYRDVNTGEIWHDNQSLALLIPGTLMTKSNVLTKYGKNIYALLSEGVIEEVSVHDNFVKYPLKFSFSATAEYKRLPAAKSDPLQGF